MILFDDNAGRYRKKPSYHLISDIPGPEGERELIEFAESLGMNVEWIQNPGTIRVHFDCMGGMIERARVAGAEQVSYRKLCRIIHGKRGRK